MGKFNAVTSNEMEMIEGGFVIPLAVVSFVAGVVGASAKTAAVAKTAYAVSMVTAAVGIAESVHQQNK